MTSLTAHKSEAPENTPILALGMILRGDMFCVSAPSKRGKSMYKEYLEKKLFNDKN